MELTQIWKPKTGWILQVPRRLQEITCNEAIDDNLNTMLRHLGHRDKDISHDWKSISDAIWRIY